jgi:CO/xanthine dehydrogenase Mo-binding subunit
MDEIARALDLDPLEVRRINYLKTGEPNPTGQTIESAAWLEETATRALAGLGEKTADEGSVKVGWGLASYFQSYGRITWFHDTARAWLGVELDGTAVIRCGVPDHGGGQVNSLAQITAEILGVSLGDVTVYSTDSAVTPLAGTTTATRQLYMSGNAVHKAASAVREVLLNRASKHFEEPVDILDLADNRVFIKSDPERSMPLRDLIARCASEGLPLSNLALFTAPFTDGIDPDTGQGDVFPDFTFGAQAVEVAVDTETGQITVSKSIAAHDVGRAINPLAVEGQIQGGSTQGLGYALMEEFVVEKGITQTPSLSEYLIPTSVDFPTTEVVILESGTGVGPFGAKGIGEPALTPAAPAVANAVADAIGVRIYDLPITPEKVLEALDKL